MFHLLGKIPAKFHLACSGGSDSMVIADFLLKFPRYEFDILHFNHGTEYCDEAEAFVTEFAKSHRLGIHVGRIESKPDGKGSIEDFWRKARYGFFSKFKDRPIVMCHHLNDCIETWVMTSMSGKPKTIPYRNDEYGIVRPFLCVPKSEIEAWARRHAVSYVVDGSNSDTRMNRNYVRHVMMPHVRRLNPGIEKTVRNIIKAEYEAKLSS